ncbi:unnamed protein product [Moneuplotes crassus]|uniref:Uncharacterized protein n=1 Tax=Euplotes crassus TaxID=5936 RepID=A0AAD1Y582_EUPCR|nr:unnamed protein product [Moneuplotes crassus]
MKFWDIGSDSKSMDTGKSAEYPHQLPPPLSWFGIFNFPLVHLFHYHNFETLVENENNCSEHNEEDFWIAKLTCKSSKSPKKEHQAALQSQR